MFLLALALLLCVSDRQALILAFCFVCYVLAARWLYVSALLMAAQWSAAAATVIVVLLLLAALATVRSVVEPRSVLSESAVVLLQVSLALQSWLRARLAEDPDQIRLWIERGADGWLLERALPLALDGLAVALLILLLQARLADADDEMAQQAQARAASLSASASASSAGPRHSGSSAASSVWPHLYRAAGVVALTAALQWAAQQLQQGEGAESFSVFSAGRWLPDSAAASVHSFQTAAAAVTEQWTTWASKSISLPASVRQFLSADPTAEGAAAAVGTTSSAGGLADQLAAVAATAAAALPCGCLFLLRALVALLCSFAHLRPRSECEWELEQLQRAHED